IRAGEDEPSPESVRTAMRDVVGRCLFGVDVNPMAVELCKVSLWMEAIEPGKPLSFLDGHIQCGNSLLGTTPALMEKGIPDEAFEALEGDDKDVARRLKKRNKQKQATLFAAFSAEPKIPWNDIASQVANVEAAADNTLDSVRNKEKEWAKYVRSADYVHEKVVADAWCAAFLWPRQKGELENVAPVEEIWRQLSSDSTSVPGATLREVARLAEEFQLLHWRVTFPQVFSRDGGTGGTSADGIGGFDVVLGNPPWEQTEVKEKEWFSARGADIAGASTGAIRKEMIEKLRSKDPGLYAEFQNEKSRHEAMVHFVANSNRYPLCGRGRMNTYALFAEAMRGLVSSGGRVGCILPSGIVTDDTTKLFFQAISSSSTLVSLYDFENAVGLFPGVGHGRFKFCLLTLSGSTKIVEAAEFAFFCHHVADLQDEGRRFILKADEIALLNPNTRTSPVFRNRRDAELTKEIYRRVPVLLKTVSPEENPWETSFLQGLFNMTSDSHLFRTRGDLESEGFQLKGNSFENGEGRFLPLYEAKMVHHFDHRFGDYSDYGSESESSHLPDVPTERLQDPWYSVLPRYWV
ncbi:MAG: SAM-dependent DNA methyltransferase, partial [Bacteroidota bacterium]